MKSSLHRDYFTPWGDDSGEPSVELMKIREGKEKEIVKKEATLRREKFKMRENVQ